MTASYNLSQLGSNYVQGGTGSVARTTASKLQESVSVKDFGAVGDGVTDDTTAIQNALNTGKCVIGVTGDTYLISTTLTISVAATEFNGNNCNFKIKSGSLTGSILNGTIFSITADRVVLTNFALPYNSAVTLAATVDGNGIPVSRRAITIGGSNNSVISNIVITNDRSQAVTTWNGGIVMLGGNVNNALITGNVLTQCAYGINYTPESYSGNSNSVIGNRLADCYYNIYSSDPGSNTCIGNIVQGNYISFTTFTCYMGIENYTGASQAGTSAYGVFGTKIVGNTITGSSSSVPVYYAISAVGKDCVVDGNVITDWYPSLSTGTAGIEVYGNSGSVVTNNIVKWTNTPEGVASTGRIAIVSSGDALNGPIRIIGNKIENANYGVWYHPGAAQTALHIIGNSFRGCARAIYTDGTTSALIINSNVIEVTRPQTAARQLVYIGGGKAEICSNIIEFQAASSQNTYTTSVFLVASDNVTIANNFGNCGNYSFAAEVIAIWTSGGTPTNCLVTNNTFIGGMHCYYDSFTQVQGFGNIVPSAIHGVSNNKLAFYDGQSPVVQSTGYGTATGAVKLTNFPGATATLAQTSAMVAQLITDLKAVNLIGV